FWRDLLAAMAPHDVLEHFADVLRLVERRQHGANGFRPALVTSHDGLDQLFHDRPGGGSMSLVTVQGQPVPAQADRALEPLAERVENAVLHPRELRRDDVRDIQDLLHPFSVETVRTVRDERLARSGQLFLDQLRDRRAVCPARDLVHDACHHPAQVPDTRRSDLGDDVVDDLFELLLGERLRHELLENLELVLLVLGALLPAARAEGLRSLDPPLALALEDLQLLVLGQRPLQLLLRVTQRVQDQAQSVAAIVVAGEPRRFQLLLDALDEGHDASAVRACTARCASIRPPSTCQWRWKIVWPAPGPTLTSTR